MYEDQRMRLSNDSVQVSKHDHISLRTKSARLRRSWVLGRSRSRLFAASGPGRSQHRTASMALQAAPAHSFPPSYRVQLPQSKEVTHLSTMSGLLLMSIEAQGLAGGSVARSFALRSGPKARIKAHVGRVWT